MNKKVATKSNDVRGCDHDIHMFVCASAEIFYRQSCFYFGEQFGSKGGHVFHKYISTSKNVQCSVGTRDDDVVICDEQTHNIPLFTLVVRRHYLFMSTNKDQPIIFFPKRRGE